MWIVTAGDPVRRTSGHVRHAGRCCRGRDRIDDACADVQRDQPGTQGRPWPPDVAPHERTLRRHRRSEEHTSELRSLMRISSAAFCLTIKTPNYIQFSLQIK